jgi:hypothetical protein
MANPLGLHQMLCLQECWLDGDDAMGLHMGFDEANQIKIRRGTVLGGD